MRPTILTISEFVAMTKRNVSGTEIVTVDLDSDMDGKGKMRLTDNPFKGLGVVKRETLNGMIGYIYANSVNRLASKEGADSRNAKRHPWGDMDEKHLFRIHRGTGKAYLSMKVEKATVHGFFLPDGSEIPSDEIRCFIPVKTKSSTQSDLEGEIIARDYAMANVRAIRMRGQEFRIIPDPPKVEQEKTEPETETVSA